MTTRLRTLGIPVVVVASLAWAQAPVAAAATDRECANRNNNTTHKLLECVTVEGVREHQKALQVIANRNGGNRFSGLSGYDASKDYVVDRLRAAGYRPTVQAFDYLASTAVGPSALAQTAPATVAYQEGVDFQVMAQSDVGDVTAAVTPVDVVLAQPAAVTSGCEGAFATDPVTGETVPDPSGPSDFDGFPAGNIALIQRGTCSFETKAANAAAAGAVGVVLFNQGNAPDRVGLINGTLGVTNHSGIPVVEATFARGAEWAGTAGLRMRLFANVLRETKTTYNVLAETEGGDDGNVVMVGAHLDSVIAGPGINDNGSGSAAILEVAEAMRKVKPTNTVRFAWWGAEESGLVGSRHYVASLSQPQLQDIALYLNFDMVGSPNYVRFVYDGSGDTFGLAGPPGSAAIEDLFDKFYADRGLAYEPTQIDDRSDYTPFRLNDIPFGGLFSGAEDIKTPEQAAVYGGTAGAPYDPCYHQACDTYPNVSPEVLALNSKAIAFATLTYAMSTESVNGQGRAAARQGAAASTDYLGSQAVR